jgi:predicted 3-demethylubiquinone-9 3-methyltransferase (glyoxalase superfamily)
MQKITPFLWFESGGKEAAEFYISVFGPQNAQIKSHSVMSETPSGTVELLAVELFKQDFTFMTAGPFRKFNEAISFVVSCDTQDEVDRYWNALSAVPEAEQCGWLKDKFGVSWQIVPIALPMLMNDPDPKKSRRVQEAMLKMKKIDIAALESAATALL